MHALRLTRNVKCLIRCISLVPNREREREREREMEKERLDYQEIESAHHHKNAENIKIFPTIKTDLTS